MKQQNISLLQSLMSYLLEIKLSENSTNENGKMLVSLNSGRISLSTQNAIYSFEDKYYTFKTALENIKPELEKAQNALILGFGMGSITWMIRNLYNNNIHITGVEYDKWILEQFKQYYSFKNIEFINEEANKYLKNSTEKFDLIFVDLFTDDYVPEEFQSIDFFKEIKKNMKDNSKVIFNFLPKDSIEDCYGSFQKVFSDAKTIHARKNRILLGGKSR